MGAKAQHSAAFPASTGGERAAESGPGSSPPSACFEKHFEPAELAKLWGFSADKVRRMFEHEPGVLVIEDKSPLRGSRRYRTLRIPASVAERVHRRLSQV